MSTPTDRELIEFAAKAAGKTRGEWDYDWLVGLGHEISRDMLWNPLVDDGAAMRLGVQLGLFFRYMTDRSDLFQRFYLEELDRDLRPSEATRRAVTRVAYEIGKDMP